MSADGSREPWWKTRFCSNAVLCNCSYTTQYPAGHGHLVVSSLPSEFCWMAHPRGQLPLALQKAAFQQISFLANLLPCGQFFKHPGDSFLAILAGNITQRTSPSKGPWPCLYPPCWRREAPSKSFKFNSNWQYKYLFQKHHDIIM